MPRFIITDPQSGVQVFEVIAPAISIGRAASNDLILDDPSISRDHARVTASGESFLLSDNASLNGVFVNGRQVEQHLLEHRDQINLGLYELRYEAPADPLAMETIAGPASELAALLAEKTPTPVERQIRT